MTDSDSQQTSFGITCPFRSVDIDHVNSKNVDGKALGAVPPPSLLNLSTTLLRYSSADESHTELSIKYAAVAAGDAIMDPL